MAPCPRNTPRSSGAFEECGRLSAQLAGREREIEELRSRARRADAREAGVEEARIGNGGKMPRTAFAVGAHPDDIEFMMAGTVILLEQAGYDIHYMNLASGSCGTVELSRDEIVRVRGEEARAAAAVVGATFHAGLVDDIELLYDRDILKRLGAVMREVSPEILLVPSPDDYMEDHMSASRLAVTAAFCTGMRNFPTEPPTSPVQSDCTIYHALPYGLRDGMRRVVHAGQYVDIGGVIGRKREMLARHRSQKEWLDRSQGTGSYLRAMEDMCASVGRMSSRFEYAEGWRRHSHLGFSPEERDPLTEALGEKVFVDEVYERRLRGR